MIEATDILQRKQFYVLKSFNSIHFHCPGEHFINGDQPNLSLHMVFQREGLETHEDHYAVMEIRFIKTAQKISSNLRGDVFLKKMNIQNYPVNIHLFSFFI